MQRNMRHLLKKISKPGPFLFNEKGFLAGVVILLGGATPLVALAAQAPNAHYTGGYFYPGMDGSDACSGGGGNSGAMYIGQCSTFGDASDADVVLDVGEQDHALSGSDVRAIGGAVWGEGTASRNSVVVEDVPSNYGADLLRVYGGLSGATGDAVENSVHMRSGKLTGLYGGSAVNGDVRDNVVEVTGNSVLDEAFGANTNWGEARNNSVLIENSEVLTKAVGGYAHNGDAISNSVTVQEGSSVAMVVGGAASGWFVIEDEDTDSDLPPEDGDATALLATDNFVSVSDSHIGSVIGGMARDGAEGNDVSLHNVSGIVPGPDESGGLNVAGGRSTQGNVFHNRVTITNTSTQLSYEGTEGLGVIVGGVTFEGSDSQFNEVVIKNSHVSDNSSDGGMTGDGDMEGDGYPSDGSVADKEPFILGGSTGSSDPASTASNNRVIVDNSTIGGSVAGGLAITGTADNNRVVLKNAPRIAGTLQGGVGIYSEGNVLEVHTTDAQAHNVAQFQQYDFLLPSDTKANDVVLTLNDPEGTDLSGVAVGVGLQTGSNYALEEGDRVSLVHNKGGVDSSGVEQTELTGYENIALQYTFSLDSDEHNLYAVLDGVGLTDQAVAPVEGRLALLGLVSQGAEAASSVGLSAAWGAAQRSEGLAGFVVLDGGHSRYKTGSHIKLSNFNTLLGLSVALGADRDLLVGGFVEAGWGRHRSYNRFDHHSVYGRGNAHYAGVGLMLEKRWSSGLRFDASARGGRSKVSWGSDDLRINGNSSAHQSYSSRSSYYGAQLGFGYEHAISSSSTLDWTFKYYWAHVGRDSATMAGDRYRFSSMDSHRTRVGVQLNHALNQHATVYTALAWDREYKGNAQASVQGLRTATPSLKGNTGVFALGLRLLPEGKSALSLDANVEGYAGRRRGVAANLTANWAF